MRSRTKQVVTVVPLRKFKRKAGIHLIHMETQQNAQFAEV